MIDDEELILGLSLVIRNQNWLDDLNQLRPAFLWRRVFRVRRVTPPTRATLGDPTFYTFPYKMWRIV